MARSRVVSHRPGRRRIVVACAIALAVPAVGACNSIIGLSDFDKGECPGARCGDGGDLPDRFVEGGNDAPIDAPPDVKGADPVSWAKWPMPNYGEGGVGNPPRPPVLTLAGDTVTDEITKLVWRALLVPGGDMKLSDADVACKKLGAWRVPKRIELVTLLDYSKNATPYIDSTKFKDINNDVVWTSSEVRPFSATNPNQLYWVVSFTTGAVEQQPASFKANVLCVAAK